MSRLLPARVLATALLRRANDSGGMALVLARGDADAGMILIVTCEKGSDYKCLEQSSDLDGRAVLRPVGPMDGDLQAITDYWQRRRARDPDLWVIELDIAQAERFAAETMTIY